MEEIFKLYRTGIEKMEDGKSYINLDYLYKYKNLLTVRVGSSIRLKFSDKELKKFLSEIKDLKDINAYCTENYGSTFKNYVQNLNFKVKKIEDRTIVVSITLKDTHTFIINPWNINESTVNRDMTLNIGSHRTVIDAFLKGSKDVYGYITNEKGKIKFIDDYYYDFINNTLYAKNKYIRIGNKYYLKTSNVLATDIRTGKLELKRNLTALISDIIDGKPTFVYTSEKGASLPIYISKETLKTYGDGVPKYDCGNNISVIHCSDYKVALKLGFVEDFTYGVFKENKNMNLENVLPYPKYKVFNFTKGKDDFKTKYEASSFGVASFTNLINQGKDYTFGIELETSHGYMPAYAAKDLNLRCVRDGSVQGGEYVTGVLTGDSGLQHLSKICNQLIKRCGVDKTTGLHVHIGNAKFNKEFIVLAYILGMKIEEDMSSILPKSRLGNHYCRNLEQSVLRGYKTAFKDIYNKGNINYDDYKLFIDTYYEILYNFYLAGGGMLGKNYNKKKDHPGKRWNSTRYFWLNLQPCMFATADSEGVVKTIKEVHNVKKGIVIDRINPNHLNIEFRNHSGTLSFNKIKNWLLICKAFVYYVENNKLDILNKPTITLEDLVCNAYTDKEKPKYYLKSNLLQYIKQRREKFINFDEDYKSESKENENPTNVKEMMSDEKAVY